MKVFTRSLADTLDSINEDLFFGNPVKKTEKVKVAEWIVGRHGQPRAYANMFAPTPSDFKGIRVFTGEKLSTLASIAHILGEEACRALILLDVDVDGLHDSLYRASIGMKERLVSEDRIKGTYCCGICTCSYWRHLAVGGLENGELELVAGLRELKKNRDGKGRWRRFPFYYTLLALSELDFPEALTEIKYAAPSIERSVRKTPETRYEMRRKALMEHVLEKI